MNEDMTHKLVETYKTNRELRSIERQAIMFMAHVIQSKYSTAQVKSFIPRKYQSVFKEHISGALSDPQNWRRTRAQIIVFYLVGINRYLIAEFLQYQVDSVRKIFKRFERGDFSALFSRKRRFLKKDKKENREKLFALMHAPPGNFGINRTTWTIDLLHDVLQDDGTTIGKNTICKMIREEDYSFRKTRQVLTSNDPDYREKLDSITRTLRRLGSHDKFFSINEYGPVSVRQRGGRRRVRRGEKPTVPQYQNSKGWLIVTAALELSSNQITHFYSKKKDTEKMIRLMKLLLNDYRGCRRLYFSWDAASWHSSKKFLAEVRRVNSKKYRTLHNSPTVILKPLPARAQFLNVIEAVFSGMARAIIHRSNYQSVDEAKTAIDRYIPERNLYFRKHPSRAGNKIWGNERVATSFSVANNCKDPKLMGTNSYRKTG